MRAAQGRKALAASFVMTFAAGCDSGKTTAPAAAPTVDVGLPPVPSPMPGPVASGAPSVQAPSPESSTAQAAPLPAPSVGRVVRRDDGTCIWYADVHCPRMANGRVMPCNPPPPRHVQCPEDAGP